MVDSGKSVEGYSVSYDEKGRKRLRAVVSGDVRHVDKGAMPTVEMQVQAHVKAFVEQGEQQEGAQIPPHVNVGLQVWEGT